VKLNHHDNSTVSIWILKQGAHVRNYHILYGIVSIISCGYQHIAIGYSSGPPPQGAGLFNLSHDRNILAIFFQIALESALSIN